MGDEPFRLRSDTSKLKSAVKKDICAQCSSGLMTSQFYYLSHCLDSLPRSRIFSIKEAPLFELFSLVINLSQSAML